jgi:hypothetical protein
MQQFQNFKCPIRNTTSEEFGKKKNEKPAAPKNIKIGFLYYNFMLDIF